MTSPFRLSKNLLFCKHCRGDPWSPAEKQSFSDFPRGNNLFFALRRHILLCKICGRPRVAPTTAFFDTLGRGHDPARQMTHQRRLLCGSSVGEIPVLAFSGKLRYDIFTNIKREEAI